MTNHFIAIQQKLEAFIKRYYINELLKGTILFFAIGLLYLLLTLFIEHLLWLNSVARTVLFWSFIIVACGLLLKFIVLPLAKLFKLKKGIDYKQASSLIGQHFPEVNDKLLNVLQLNDSTLESELLLASIQQKSVELSPVPFKLAVNFKQNIKYLKYAAIPLLIILFAYITGHVNWFSDSYKRVVNYNMAYQPPAPFQFFVVNSNLDAIENKAFVLKVNTTGHVLPENASISYNNETYMLKQLHPGVFQYTFTQPTQSLTFKLHANGVTSRPYNLNVLQVPTLVSFDMHLNYPNYTLKKSDILKSTGNAIVPEGTKVSWKLKANATDYVRLYSKDTTVFTNQSSNVFVANKTIYSNFDYSLSTSNAHLKDYENLGFKIKVIKDQYPELKIDMKVDTLDKQTLYFHGSATDDYGLTKLQLVYYPTNNEAQATTKIIKLLHSNVTEFLSTFPDNFDIEDGIPYTLYFQVFDNDAINKHKYVKSNFFTYRKRTQEEERERNLIDQNNSIQGLDRTLKDFNKQDKELKSLTKTQKEKQNLNFNDKKKLTSFLERQQQQDKIMKQFNKKFQENIEKLEENIPNNSSKEELKERLSDNEKQLEQDEKLLEELKKIQDKISNEDLINKLEELGKQNKNKERSLEQLLELTKRYYVQQKMEKLNQDLLELAEKQKQLSNAPEGQNTKEKQDNLNQDFQDFQEQMEQLIKDDKSLNKPFDITQDKLSENEIKKEQQSASEALESNENKSQSGSKQSASPKENMQNAQKSQKNAAKKMKQMAEGLASTMVAATGEQLQEDADMLRQILDNLLLFSFDQEALMYQFEAIVDNHNKYATYLKKQYSLKAHFEHVDDSLFALSLRQPKLSENVNKQISDVYYNMDRALHAFADNNVYQGVSSQQFVVTAANNLADFLSDVLDNMESQLSMTPSMGSGGDMQLPDIIMSQEQLNKMMKEGMQKSESGKQQSGDTQKPGESDKESNDSKGEKSGGDSKSKTGQEPKDQGQYSDEYLDGLLFEIYQKQQDLRNQLQDKLAKSGLTNNATNLLKRMEHVELDLLNHGFTQQTMDKMLQIQHELLKLENATLEQGEDTKRESKFNTNTYTNPTNSSLPSAKDYFKTTEILNKQSLPLQPVYKKKVQTYFQKAHD